MCKKTSVTCCFIGLDFEQYADVFWKTKWFALVLQVERNIQKVSDAYETLAQHSQKRENLEKLMRLKLDSEISRLTEVNQQVQGNLIYTTGCKFL